jgi:hypothetical protein
MPDSWRKFRADIDQKLAEHRPARIGADEHDWREPVYGWARNHIPDESNIVKHFAQQEVDRREGVATKAANRFLRNWTEGVIPLLWDGFGALPLVVPARDGTTELRVRLDAATPEDLNEATRKLRGDAKVVYDRVLVVADGIDDLALGARRRGFALVHDLGDLAPRRFDPSGFLCAFDADDESPLRDDTDDDEDDE